MGAGTDRGTAVPDVLVGGLIGVGVDVARGITVGGGGSRSVNGSSAWDSDVGTGCSSIVMCNLGGDSGLTTVGWTAGDFDGDDTNSDVASATCSREDVGVGESTGATAGVRVLSVTSGLRLPRGKDTTKTSSPSSGAASRGGVGARGGGRWAEECTMASELVPESLTRYVEPWPR